MAPPPLALMKDVRLSLGGDPLFEGVTFALGAGERACLVGRNGAGKSTLMRMLAGRLGADSGDVWIQPGARVVYLAQEPDMSGFDTALDYVADGLADPERDYYRAEGELDLFGLDPAQPIKGMSGGQARRAALARAFAADPDVLLLDEPTNHLDIAAIEYLETRIKSYRGALLTVSHDRRFLTETSTLCLWLRQGQVLRLDRGYGAFEGWADEVEEAESRALEKVETQLKAEHRWLARGVTGRRKRNMGRLSRLHEMRDQRRALKGAQADGARVADLATEAGSGSGKLVADVRGLTKRFTRPDGTQLTIADSLDLRIMRGDRLGLIGPNGIGKTTLVNLLLGLLPPDAGTVKLGTRLEIAFLDQQRARLDPEATIWDTLAPQGGDQVMVRDQPRHVASYAKQFLFSSAQLRQPVRALSGGERNRLLLALALAQPSNMLVLDEPTNDLDMDTLEQLEDMLDGYDGTLILVSHDRAFIDAIVTSVLAPEGEGRWREYPGGYADYERQRRSDRVQGPGSDTRQKPKSLSQSTLKATKLTYKDQRRLDELSALIETLPGEIKRLEAALSDPAFFARDPAGFDKTVKALDAARARQEAAELDWLDLEEKREALARGG
jgi:ABC transport system ATP-binding/permease protein